MESASTALRRTYAFILAGGQGQRMLPLTISRPKPLIPFGGIFRIIDFTLWNCVNSGITHGAVLTQYRHEDIKEDLRKNWIEFWARSSRTHPASLQCLEPVSGKRYRGTADAVYQNLAIIKFHKPAFVLILSGDHIYDMDYRDLIKHHAESNADLTVAAVEYPSNEASHFGVLEVDSNLKVTGFDEKPSMPRQLADRPGMSLISMGVYVFKTDVLIRALLEHCGLGNRYDFGHDIIPSLIASRQVLAYDFRDSERRTPGYWRDVGTLDSYYRANMDLVEAEPPLNPYLKNGWRFRPEILLHDKTSVSGTARLARSITSPGVRIAEGAFVEECVLLPGVRIGKGAQLRRVIVEDGVSVPEGSQAGFDIGRDRLEHGVTAGGVVLISSSPKPERVALPRSGHVLPFSTRSKYEDSARTRPLREL